MIRGASGAWAEQAGVANPLEHLHTGDTVWWEVRYPDGRLKERQALTLSQYVVRWARACGFAGVRARIVDEALREMAHAFRDLAP